MRSFSRACARWAGTLLLASLGAQSAHAYVSVGPGCDKATLQEAIGTVGNNGVGEFHLVSGALHERGPIVIGDRKRLRIYGGYPSCDAPDATPFTGDFSTLTKLDASPYPGHPAIDIASGAQVDIRHFEITGAQNSGNNVVGNGGGIAFSSGDVAGHLETHATFIHDNEANKGAGIYYHGGARTDTLQLFEDTLISLNEATHFGGGLSLSGDVVATISSPKTAINSNRADADNHYDGRGGGIHLEGNAKAVIGSPGYGIPVLFGNYAPRGGGIAAQDETAVQLYSTVAGEPVRVENNAAVTGGGIYMDISSGAVDVGLCGAGYSISANQAESGAALYATQGSRVYLDSAANCALPPPDIVACPAGEICNHISRNTVVASDLNYAAVIAAEGGGAGVFRASQVDISGNVGPVLLNVQNDDSDGAGSSLQNCMITRNTATRSWLLATRAQFTMDGCTIADNDLRHPVSTAMIYLAKKMVLERSIVWQPGSDLAEGEQLGSNLHLIDLLISDVDFGATAQVLRVTTNEDPRFVDDGSYGLRHDSPAIDYSNDCAEGSVDAFGLPRRVAVRDGSNPCDLGAVERSTVAGQTFPTTETFEETDPHAIELPAGWGNDHGGANDGWHVTSQSPDDGRFAIHSADPGGVGQAMLTSPEFISPPNAKLAFRHAFQLEATYDVAVLEISIDDAPFVDILDAGGRFEQGGYNSELVLGAGPNPIGPPGRPVWSGDDGTLTYHTVVVDLPAQAQGRRVNLRWHVGSDASGTHNGYWLDTIELTAGTSDEIFLDGFD